MIDKVASVNITLQRACPITETKISPTSVILVSQLGKCWVDIDFYLLAYATFLCQIQDGGAYLGERYLDFKVPTEEIQATVKPERPTTNLCFVFIIWGYVWNTLPGITSQLQGLGVWGVELNSAPPPPPASKKHRGYWERSPFQSDFLLHKSLFICFPQLISFQGLLGRKHELLRSD